MVWSPLVMALYMSAEKGVPQMLGGNVCAARGWRTIFWELPSPPGPDFPFPYLSSKAD